MAFFFHMAGKTSHLDSVLDKVGSSVGTPFLSKP